MYAACTTSIDINTHLIVVDAADDDADVLISRFDALVDRPG